MIHRTYNNFLNEKQEIDQIQDLINIMDALKDEPTENILAFRDLLGDVNENLNESKIGDILFKLKDKFRRSVYDKIWSYMINQKKNFYMLVKDKLNIFDLSNLDDIILQYPNFKMNGLYLAGGMDKAADVGAGWRYIVENEFETYKRPSKNSGLPEINMGTFGDVEPCRVIEGEYLNMYLENKNATEKLYPGRPLTLNPVRKEVDRTKDKDFAGAAKNYKTFKQDTPIDEYEPTIGNIRTTLSKTIEPDDEHLVRLTDATLLGLNKSAASGTFGELQQLSFMNKPIFVWMTEPGWELKDFSMWTFPHISKLARNENEMKQLVHTLIDYAEK